MIKINKKYRIPSARAQWWDYGSNAAYFVTICTDNRIHYFGEIENQKMILTELGKYADICWHEIPQHFPFVQLGAFVVMPNHVHGIIIIDKTEPAVVETQYIASLQQKSPKNKFGPQSQNLASIIRGYKIGVTKSSKIGQSDFKWQPLFHDHIIRDAAEYQRINNYIETNVLNWGKDKFFEKDGR